MTNVMSPDSRSNISSAKTIAFNENDFDFETLEEQNGLATVIKFRLDDPYFTPGDVLVVMSDEEIHFHGMIGRIEDGWAIATDRRGSLLAATVQ